VNIDNKLQAAFEYFQKGNLEQAELVCKDIPKLQPDNPEHIKKNGFPLRVIDRSGRRMTKI